MNGAVDFVLLFNKQQKNTVTSPNNLLSLSSSNVIHADTNKLTTQTQIHDPFGYSPAVNRGDTCSIPAQVMWLSSLKKCAG